MPPSDLLEALRVRPFVPFRIHVSEGATYEIRHPEMMLVGIASVIIAIPADPASPYYTRTETVAARHIIRLVPLHQPVSPATNGEN